jgi:hypothetical protein
MKNFVRAAADVFILFGILISFHIDQRHDTKVS